MYKYLIQYTFLAFTCLLVLGGCLGVLKGFGIPLAAIICTLFLGFKLVRGENIKLSNGIKVHALFLITLLIHTIIFEGKIIYFWMFLTGGLFYINFYNLRSIIKINYFINFIIFLGLIMILVNVLLRVNGTNYYAQDNLFLPNKDNILHNHIGDLWAFIMLGSIFTLVKKFNLSYLVITLVGIPVILLSYSRSALISLIGGLIYLISYVNTKDKFKINKISLLAFFFICFSGLVFFGREKSILTSRPYFFEAITSIFVSPMGIGMGKFNEISISSNNVHNFILEVIVGMGVFSIPFLYWLYKYVLKSIRFNSQNVIYNAVLLGIIINFMFDSTYVIPGVLWIFYICLALIA